MLWCLYPRMLYTWYNNVVDILAPSWKSLFGHKLPPSKQYVHSFSNPQVRTSVMSLFSPWRYARQEKGDWLRRAEKMPRPGGDAAVPRAFSPDNRGLRTIRMLSRKTEGYFHGRARQRGKKRRYPWGLCSIVILRDYPARPGGRGRRHPRGWARGSSPGAGDAGPDAPEQPAPVTGRVGK